MRLAIADPPYLGRASLWYGGGQHPHYGTPGRAKGRTVADREWHPDAAQWDDPERHMALMTDLDLHWDGWAMAASAKTLGELLPHADLLGYDPAEDTVDDLFPGSGAVSRVIAGRLL